MCDSLSGSFGTKIILLPRTSHLEGAFLALILGIFFPTFMKGEQT